jgi:RHS repeat-associated protein
VSGVGLTTLDRFYLDGQRLVPTSGNYGDAGATYQTDNDIFTRVSQQSTTTYGPGWFKAETKSGLVFEYGNTPGSKHQIPGFSQIVNWHVSKVSDLFGNQINYAYIQDNCTVYPAEITYGPNTVTFYYKERSDKTSGYLRGVKMQQCLLLDRITVKYNTNVVKTYEFKYASQGPYYNKYSTLNEIIEFGTGTSRYNSTAINYQIPANVNFALTMDNTDNLYVSYNSFLVSGDYDGNGKGDFLCIPDHDKGASWTGLRVYYGDGNFYFPTYGSESTSIDLSVLKDIQSVDINGDGRDDVLFEAGNTLISQFFYLLNDGTPFAAPVLIYQQTFNQVTGFPGKRRRNTEKQEDDNLVSQDFNGDGVNDILIIGSGGTWRIYSFVNSYGQLTSSLNLLGNGTISTLATEALSGDFNGDGKSDIWSFEETGLKIYTYSGGSYMTLLYSSTWPSKRHFFNLGDYNGDGKIDVFLYGSGRDATEYDWTEWQIQLSTGTGFEGFLFPAKKTNLKDDLVRQGDFNGDGSADIMASPREISWSGSKYYISKNNGTDFYYHQLPTYPPASQNVYLTDLNGDARTEFITTDASVPYRNGYQVFSNPGNTSVLMEKIADGLGVLTKPSYIRLSQASSGIYQRGSGSVYPVSDFQGPMTVVSSVLVDNGKGSMNTQNYYYEGAKIHLRGKGFLGYTKSGISDVASAIASENIIINGFHSTYFYPQIQMSLRKISGTSDTIEKIKNTMTHLLLASETKRIFIYPQVSVTTNNKTGHKVTVTTSSYDNYGNPGSIVKTYLGGPTETVTSQYNNTVSSSLWLLGRPTSATLQFSKSGENTITRTGTRVFSSTSNNLSGETWYSGTGNQFVKGFKYNTNGSLKRDSITAGGVYRTNIYTYETNGVRIKTITDPLSHTTTSTYDNYGRLSTRADYLGNTLTYTYDDMGREATISSTDGNQTATTFTWEIPASVLKTARFSVLKTGNDGSQAKSWFDKLGREIRSDVKGFDGTWIYTDTRYNIKGQVDSISEPYYTGPLWNRYQYDNYGRKTSLNRPSGRNTTWTYSSNVITETTAGRSYHKTYSSDGTVSSAEDPGGTIYYTYYPDGKVKTITAPGTIVTQMQYDIAGNQTRLIDPSAGTINYTYNGFGELLTQQNARLQTTTITYNSNGTIYRKVSPEGTTKYRYNANKQLTNISSPGSVSRSFAYDSKGRVITITDTIPGTTPLVTNLAYDTYGRTGTITHPSGIAETKAYNSHGYMNSVSAGGSTRWTTSSVNARQQVTSGTYGSSLNASFGYDSYGFPASRSAGSIQNYNYSFDPVTGNLNWRKNVLQGNIQENFEYDNLDRLDRVYRGATTLLDMAYDVNKGSITTKSDAGTLNYNISAKPYALGTVNPSTGLLPAAIDSLTYTSFESVNTIWEGNFTSSFTYNGNNERAKMEVKQNGSAILTRWYRGSGFIRETTGGVTKDYTFIGGDAYTSPVVAITQSGTTTYYNLLRDHLGSITHVVNATNNTLLYEYSYDAWGRMRDKTSWTNYSPGSEPSLFIAGRGFTGHEHLPWFNLINMNGRIYDPLVGQFLSPDNFVQDPTFTQNYNRYTYCLNNPLKYFDPSGYVKLKTWDEFQDVVNNLMETGGSWNSETGYSYGNQGGGGDYGIPSGSGFQGPDQPYMLGEVTVTAQEPEKNNQTKDKESPWYYGIPGVGPALESGNHINHGNYWAAAASFGMALVDVFTLGEASGGTVLARNLGKAGENAVGIVGSKVRMPSLTGTASYRIPDRLTATTLEEVKNVQSLSLTRQLMDFNLFSQQTGRQFIIYTNATKISGPLQSLEDQGLLILNKIP